MLRINAVCRLRQKVKVQVEKRKKTKKKGKKDLFAIRFGLLFFFPTKSHLILLSRCTNSSSDGFIFVRVVSCYYITGNFKSNFISLENCNFLTRKKEKISEVITQLQCSESNFFFVPLFLPPANSNFRFNIIFLPLNSKVIIRSCKLVKGIITRRHVISNGLVLVFAI